MEDTTPPLVRVGVVMLTVAPDAVLPAVTLTKPVDPDVMANDVPAVVSAVIDTLVSADKLIDPAAVVPPMVSKPPFAPRVSEPPDPIVPVDKEPEAVVIEMGLPVATTVPPIEFSETLTALAPPLKFTVSVAKKSPVLPAAVMAPAVPALKVTSEPAPAAERREPAPKLRVSELPAPLPCMARSPALADSVPLLLRVGVLMITLVPDAVVPLETVTELAGTVPDVTVSVVPAVVPALIDMSVEAVNEMVVAPLVVPPTVRGPPFAVKLKAAPDEIEPVESEPVAVVMETGVPVATTVPVIELTERLTAATPPLKLTMSAAKMSPVAPAEVIEPEEVVLKATSEPAPAADRSDPAARSRVRELPAPLP